MSNNAPDYEDNLVFPPQEIKSQDDIKHQDTRSSDVLIKAVEKCEKLEKQLGIAVKKLQIARDLLSSGRPFPYLALEHIEYALERIKAIDEVRS
jgi:hypothetical protein